MNTTLDELVKQKIKKTFDSFLGSLQKGGTALTTFLGSWTTFDDTVRLHHDKLNDKTLLAVRDFSNFVTNVSSDMVEFDAFEEKLANDNETELTKILESAMTRLTISDKKSSQSKSTFDSITEKF